MKDLRPKGYKDVVQISYCIVLGFSVLTEWWKRYLAIHCPCIDPVLIMSLHFQSNLCSISACLTMSAAA